MEIINVKIEMNRYEVENLVLKQRVTDTDNKRFGSISFVY